MCFAVFALCFSMVSTATFTVYAEGDVITEFVYYDPEEQDGGEAYVDVTKLGYVNMPFASTVDSNAFTLRQGRVYKGDKALECEVNEVLNEIEGSIRYWSALDPSVGGAVSEAETGVYFFTHGGRHLSFIPLESGYECRGIVFSPNGERFVIVRGGGRPDAFFELYDKTMKKLAEFIGMQYPSTPAWIDPHRFVFTRIDDEDHNRNDGSVILSHRWRLSVVIYDTAVSEIIVLKEATDTQNFLLDAVIENGSAVSVSQESVKSVNDWGDPDKTEYRNIKVEVPPAG
jgi:hypothetical protein